ncbi:MAG: hypothetical protein JNM17_39425 [Archangium sp.]|nr:hypothetical protein [Archangium sp.]
MNPFHKLRDLVLWVLGDDLSSPKPKKSDDEPRVTKPPQRKPPARGDGFEAPPRARVPLDPPPAPEKREQVITTTNFDASLDDLKHVVDEPMEPQPEFIPEGGMSTQSLMQEFESLDAETQAKAVELAAAREVIPSPAPAGEGQGEGETIAAAVDAKSIAPPWLMPATTAAPRPPVPAPTPTMSTESLMSEFEPVTLEPVVASETIPSPAPAGEGQGEGEPVIAAVDAKSIAPPWLMPPTVAAPRVVAPPPNPAMSTESLMSQFEPVMPDTSPEPVAREVSSTESLMSEFDALTPETQSLAVELEAQKQLEREEAERSRAARKENAEESSFEAAPAPVRPSVDVKSIAPPWLLPPTTAAPPRVVAPSSGDISTESLMSEFESLTPETQAEAVELEAKKQAAREEAERAKDAQTSASSAPSSDASVFASSSSTGSPLGSAAPLAPTTAPVDARSIAPAWLMPATTAAPRRVAPPSGGMSTESLMSEFESLTPETQAAAVELEEQKRLAREEAEAAEDALPHPDPPPEGEGDDSRPHSAPPEGEGDDSRPHSAPPAGEGDVDGE